MDDGITHSTSGCSIGRFCFVFVTHSDGLSSFGTCVGTSLQQIFIKNVWPKQDCAPTFRRGNYSRGTSKEPLKSCEAPVLVGGSSPNQEMESSCIREKSVLG